MGRVLVRVLGGFYLGVAGLMRVFSSEFPSCLF